MSSLDDSPDYVDAKIPRSQNENSERHMRQKVQHRVLQFLLARFLLLNLLITEAFNCEGGLRPSDHRLLWVLLQVRPADMLDDDAFMELAMALRMASIDHLKKKIDEEFSKIKPILKSETVIHPATEQPTYRPLYCFLDEVQTTIATRMGEYRLEDKKTERPLLTPIWQEMTGALHPKKMLTILSGTALNEASLESILTSSLFKSRPYTIKRDIGAFDDPDSQGRYIKRYLPDGESAAMQEFFKRAWGWCRGRYFQDSCCQIDSHHFVLRYRNTAALIESVLVTGCRSPHKTLNAFVKHSTNFSPTDGEKWCADEPDVGELSVDTKWNFGSMGVSL
jgi:hypothetical protein